jgi:7-carboxy-7-deazaguanine synthase
MKINEIFFSIQGEGKWTGNPNIFIRFSECNLRCSYCDTKYAYESGREMSIEEIFKSVKKYPCKKICITGGEPLIQKNIYELINFLIKNGYEISIETNGSIDISNLINIKSLMISLDIKCPSSEMNQKMNLKNLNFITINDQLKFVIGDRKDYDYAKKIIKSQDIKSKIYLQPVWGFDPKKLSSWILEDGLDVSLSLQLQKIIWRNKIGV